MKCYTSSSALLLPANLTGGGWQFFFFMLLSSLEIDLKQFHANIWIGGFGCSAFCFLRNSGDIF